MNLFAQVDREERTASEFPEQVVGFGESWLLKSGIFHGLDPLGFITIIQSTIGENLFGNFFHPHRTGAKSKKVGSSPSFFWGPKKSRWWHLKYVLFSPLFGEMIQI